jgi:hypothetical protein
MCEFDSTVSGWESSRGAVVDTAMDVSTQLPDTSSWRVAFAQGELCFYHTPLSTSECFNMNFITSFNLLGALKVQEYIH